MRLRSAIVSMLMLLLLPGDASAQYFGKNKVQYRRHEFRVLQTEHFDIYFHQDRREAIDVVGRLAERWWRRLTRFFEFDLDGRQPIVLYSSKPDFDQTLVVPGLIDGGTAGLTEPGRRRIALSLAPSLADTDHVLGHEIVHAFQFDLLLGSTSPGARGGEPLPLWATEGLAEYLTLGPVETHTAMWLRDAVRSGTLPRLDDLDDPQYFPYRWGHAFWAYVGGRWDEGTVAELYRAASLFGMEYALDDVLTTTADDLSREWHDALRAAYPGGAPTAVGRHVAGARPLDGSINVGAALSPDGRWVAYLTERLFSVDLVVADAERGQVVATLTDTAANPRYSSLQYIGSGAAWHPAGGRLAIATLTSGRAALSIFRWPGGGLERDVVVDGVDEIFGPTWSPDGRTIAFSAMKHGASDLFAFDLDQGVLRRLTDDLYADLHPAWAPDGARLAFVTDRFTTDLSVLAAGSYRVATIDAATGVVAPVRAFAAGKHIAPQWSRDGRTLYFISDCDGIPDVYAVDLQNGALTRVTNADSGVAGLTGSSPALSIAAGADTAAVTVYEGGVFAVHLLALSGGAPATASAFQPRLPPIDGEGSSRLAAGTDAAPPPSEAFPVAPYRARLALEDVAQVSCGAGVDPYGAMAGGGLGLTFSDMLHTHWLVAGVQFANPIGSGFSVRDVAASFGYLNEARRWQWGVFTQVVPTYVGVRSGAASPDADVLSGFTVLRQIEGSLRAAASYPFSRARRLELTGGTARLAFDELTGLVGELAWTPAAESMTLGSVAAAFVSDTSHAGPTSMVSGERYRLEVAPVFGTLRYVHVTADYRRYLMPVPFFTIAARALHIGRYGSGAEDVRLPSMYLGYPWLVRGFDLGWHVDDCVAALSSGCPELGDLLGSRLGVGNLELRLPVLRPFGLSRSMYGPVPVEVAAFVDGGLAWRGGRGTGAPAWSTGVTVRSNLIGFGIGQFDIARPLSRPDAGWVVQFNLSPAF